MLACVYRISYHLENLRGPKYGYTLSPHQVSVCSAHLLLHVLPSDKMCSLDKFVRLRFDRVSYQNDLNYTFYSREVIRVQFLLKNQRK